MIIVLKSGVTQKQINELTDSLKSNYNVEVKRWDGVQSTVLGLLGDTHKVDIGRIGADPAVEDIKRVQEPYKLANRKFHPDDTVVKVGDISIGDGSLTIIAGPCSVESEEQIVEVALRVRKAGAKLLRGGAFKPRTSPYSFQGLRADGLKLLIEAKKVTGMPIVTEIMSSAHLDLFADVDIIQVGARNMQNFELLKELGKTKKPILLKRGLSSTIDETLMSAEYIMSEGNPNVILCERGIRTFETATRNTLDISAIPMFKMLSHLPVIIDPSHAAGIPSLVEPLSMAALGAGADGLMIEVHNCPAKALSDGAQSLDPDAFDDIASRLINAHSRGLSFKYKCSESRK